MCDPASNATASHRPDVIVASAEAEERLIHWPIDHHSAMARHTGWPGPEDEKLSACRAQRVVHQGCRGQPPVRLFGPCVASGSTGGCARFDTRIALGVRRHVADRRPLVGDDRVFPRKRPRRLIVPHRSDRVSHNPGILIASLRGISDLLPGQVAAGESAKLLRDVNPSDQAADRLQRTYPWFRRPCGVGAEDRNDLLQSRNRRPERAAEFHRRGPAPRGRMNGRVQVGTAPWLRCEPETAKPFKS